MSALVNLSVDLDNLSLYHRIHALEGDPDARAIYDVALPRLLDFCERLGIRMTLFVVAGDLQFDEAVTALRRAAAAGHELASHTLRHPYHLRELSESGIAEEMDEAARWMEESLGVRPLGFRTPGYNLDSRILALLAERGYRYDASVFPCPPYFAAKAAVMARMAAKGQPTGSAANDPMALLAPISPYRPSRWGFWRRGDRKHSLPLWEIPCGVMPVTRLPVIGTTICALPEGGARTLARCFRAGQRYLSVAIHAIDFMDQHDRGVQPILVAKQPDLRRSWEQKQASLAAFLETLAQTHRAVTLLEMTDALDASAGATVTGP